MPRAQQYAELTAPRWASELLEEIRLSRAPSRRRPDLEWKLAVGRRYTSASYWHASRRILVRAGSNVQDQKLAVLHEAAHWLRELGARKGSGHDRRFYLTLWSLIEEFPRVDPVFALTRESNHYKKAFRYAPDEVIRAWQEAARKEQDDGT